jgi:hypothetical protein
MVAPGNAGNAGNAVAEQRPGTLPAAAVDSETGELIVAREDGRFRTDRLDDIVYSTSTDGVLWTPLRRVNGGRTWSTALKVNVVTTDVGYAAFSRGGAFLGDYNQLAVARNGWIYLVHNEALPRRKGEPCNCSCQRTVKRSTCPRRPAGPACARWCSTSRTAPASPRVTRSGRCR